MLKVVQDSIQIAVVAAGGPVSLRVIGWPGVCQAVQIIVIFDAIVILVILFDGSVVMSSISTVRVKVAKVMSDVIIAVSLIVMFAFVALAVAIAIIIATAVRMSIIMVPTVQTAAMTELLFKSMNLPLQKVFE